jgi:ABC transporter substrate binding protein
MRRRGALALLSSAALWPFAARAQQIAMPVIGFLNGTSLETSRHLVTAFRQGLSEAGFDEGRNVAIEYRWAEGRNERLPELAKELVRRQVAVVFASAGATAAAKAATPSIPIVFAAGGDPVALGFVASLNRPGSNLTGVTAFATALEAKRMGLLRELLPSARAIAVLVNPTNANVGGACRTAQAANRLRIPRCCGSRRAHQLWHQPDGWVSAGWRLYRPHSQRRHAWGAACPSTNEVRARHQSEDRRGDGSRDPASAAVARGRGDSVMDFNRGVG